MLDKEKEELIRLIVAPYIQKATALIGKEPVQTHDGHLHHPD